VEVRFDVPVQGPLAIGDGRFLGLGIMAPQRLDSVHAFAIEAGLSDHADPAEIARALRRAVMARVQLVLGARHPLPAFFTGHRRDGTPALREQDAHLSFAFDPRAKRLLVIAPHVVLRRDPTANESRCSETLKNALVNFSDLRAGTAGRLTLRPYVVENSEDRLFERSQIWESVTTYQVTRHRKEGGAAAALVEDVREECRRCGLPEPRVTALQTRGVRGLGLLGEMRIDFKIAVQGPIILGRSSHFGGGLFASAEHRNGV